MDEKILKQFEDYMNGRKSPLTVKNYLNSVYHYLLHINTEQPTEANAESYLSYLIGKNMAARSVNRHLAAIKYFFNHILKQEVKLESFRIRKKVPQWLSKEEQIKMLRSCNGQLEKAVISSFLGGGFRVSELVSIRVEDINGEECSIKVLGKGDKERMVAVDDDTIKFIDIWLTVRTLQSELLFPYSVKTIQRMVSNIATRAGLNKKITPHTLRHAMASNFMAQGGSLVELRDQLGHTNVTITNIYSHSDIKQRKANMPKLIDSQTAKEMLK